MTEWKTVQGSQEVKPSEFDTASSKKVLYQRANIKRVTVEGVDGETTEIWQYDERQMSHDEYRLYIGLNDSIVSAEQALTDMDIQSIETQQELTDMDLRLLEVEGKLNEQ